MPRDVLIDSLNDLDQRVLALGSMVEKALDRAMSALATGDTALAQRVIDSDAQIDDARYDLESACLRLMATQQPMAIDLRLVAAVINIVSDLERMGDHAEGIAHLVQRAREDMALLPVTLELRQMADLAQRLLGQALDSYALRETALADLVRDGDRELMSLNDRMTLSLTDDMAQRPQVVARATYLLWVGHNLVQIGSLSRSIAERMHFVLHDEQ